MVMEPARCQCTRFAAACEESATQEDFLCDTCRRGCTAVIAIDHGPGLHVEENFKVTIVRDDSGVAALERR
jgi:hypothetical protein